MRSTPSSCTSSSTPSSSSLRSSSGPPVVHLSADTPRHPHRLSPAELPLTEAEVTLTLLIKVFAQGVEASRIDPCQDEGARNENHARVRLRFSFTFTYHGSWRHTHRFCGDAEFIRSVWKSHDVFTDDGDTRAPAAHEASRSSFPRSST